MAQLSFINPTLIIKSRTAYDSEWSNIQNVSVRYFISVEEQHLCLSLHILENLATMNAYQQISKIMLTARAGLIKTCIINFVSIFEGALIALGKQRLIIFRSKPTFGTVLKQWGVIDVLPIRPEIQPIQNELKLLHKVRNDLHIYDAAMHAEGQAIASTPASPALFTRDFLLDSAIPQAARNAWEGILANEEQLLNDARLVHSFLKRLPPH
jgi:hypothetical protein